jgi:hypothetical protein
LTGRSAKRGDGGSVRAHTEKIIIRIDDDEKKGLITQEEAGKRRLAVLERVEEGAESMRCDQPIPHRRMQSHENDK